MNVYTVRFEVLGASMLEGLFIYISSWICYESENAILPYRIFLSIGLQVHQSRVDEFVHM